MAQVLRHGVEVVEAVLITLHPVVHLRVEVYVLHAAEHALFVQPVRRVAVHLLRHRVIHRVVHPLLQPQPPAVAFLYLVDAVVAQRGRVLVVTEIGTDAVTVVAVQAVARAEPYIALCVAEDTEYLRVRQALTGVYTAEFHVGNHCGKGRQSDAQHRQEDRKTFHFIILS